MDTTSVVEQHMKKIFCKKLAACLCMKAPPSQSTEIPLLVTKYRGVATGDNYGKHATDGDDNTASSSADQETESTKDLLRELCELLRTCAYNEETQNYEEEEISAMRKEWLLAAAVLDRICAIAVTVIVVAGTLAFIILFIYHS